jgi:hypothetical protein
MILDRIKKQVPARTKKIIKVAALTILALFVTWSSLKLLEVKSIECYSNSGECPEENEEALSHLIGKKIYFVNEKDVKETIPSGFKELKKIFPNRLVIKLEKPKPVVILMVNNKESNSTIGSLVVSDKGEVMGVATEERLPRVNIYKDFLPREGDQITDYAAFQAVKLAQLLNSAGFPQFEIFVNSDEIEIRNLLDASILVNPNKNLESVATTLQQLLSKATITEKKPQKIDLRFDQPIVIY